MKSVGTLSRDTLRQFGWDLWDPIGLKEIACPRDEYDAYLLKVVSLLRHGATTVEVVEYLIDAETRTIGMRPRADTRDRAERLVEAVQSYVKSVPVGPIRVS